MVLSARRNPSRTSRRAFLRATGAAAAGLVAGCGMSTGAADGGVTLDLWTWALRPRFDDYMTRLVAAFEASRPGVRVVWTDVAFDAMKRKVFAAGAARKMPDVVNVSDQDFAQFAALGALLPLRGVLPGDPEPRYVAGALAACVIDDRLLALPWYLSTHLRVMNVPLLARGGLTPLTLGRDWETLRAQAAAFRERTGANLFTLPLGDGSDLPPMMLADGLTPLVPDPAGGWRADLTAPPVVDFVQQWVDFYRAGLVPRDAATGAYDAQVNNLTNGRVAMINANALARVKRDAPALYADVAVGPGVVGRLGRPHLAVTQVSVARATRHPKEAADLAWFLTGPTWQTDLAKLASRVPSTTASLSDPAFSEWSDDPQQQATVLGARQLPEARAFTPAIGPWPDLRRAFDARIKNVLLNGDDVRTALAQIEAEWNRILRADAAGMPYK